MKHRLAHIVSGQAMEEVNERQLPNGLLWPRRQWSGAAVQHRNGLMTCLRCCNPEARHVDQRTMGIHHESVCPRNCEHAEGEEFRLFKLPIMQTARC